MCCGLILVPIIVFGIFKNEQDQLLDQATIQLVTGATEVSECTPQPGLNGKLIYATGCKMVFPQLTNQLPPPVQPFLNDFQGLNLGWVVSIFQWDKVKHSRTEKTNTGGSHTVYWYTYEADWRGATVSSESFPSGHRNRGSFPTNMARYGDINAPAGTVYVQGKPGSGFYLDSSLTSQVPEKHLNPHQAAVAPCPPWSTAWNGTLQACQLRVDGIYLTTAFGDPQVGDLRIYLSGKTASDVSIAAEQAADSQHRGYATLKAYPPQTFGIFGRQTYPLEKLYTGHLPKADFIAQYQKESSVRGLVLRVLLFIVMIAACNCIFSPLSVMADLLRMINYVTCCLELGTVLDNATQCVIGLFSCLCATVTFAIAFIVCWIMVRPLIAIIMLCISIGALVGASFFHKGTKKVADAREDFYTHIDA